MSDIILTDDEEKEFEQSGLTFEEWFYPHGRECRHFSDCICVRPSGIGNIKDEL